MMTNRFGLFVIVLACVGMAALFSACVAAFWVATHQVEISLSCPNNVGR